MDFRAESGHCKVGSRRLAHTQPYLHSNIRGLEMGVCSEELSRGKGLHESRWPIEWGGQHVISSKKDEPEESKDQEQPRMLRTSYLQCDFHILSTLVFVAIPRD